ncbi:MAG: leucine-rich repeat domain-containing protein [Alphaproteobacteria bacterium]|nr:leucine-rich repeat domain-containing protein [Alphaproteobacteria bacterium]
MDPAPAQQDKSDDIQQGQKRADYNGTISQNEDPFQYLPPELHSKITGHLGDQARDQTITDRANMSKVDRSAYHATKAYLDAEKIVNEGIKNGKIYLDKGMLVLMGDILDLNPFVFDVITSHESTIHASTVIIAHSKAHINVAAFSNFANLKRIVISNCPNITDISPIKNLVNLTTFDISGCPKITEDMIKQLSIALPKCDIESGFGDFMGGVKKS